MSNLDTKALKSFDLITGKAWKDNNMLNHAGHQQKKILLALSLLLPIMAESTNYQVTVVNDDGTGLIPETLSWAILQANENPGHDQITLTTDTTITGVMTRLIDSDVTIQSDQISRSISGGGLFRPLFIKSGNVDIKNIDFLSGLAQGGGSSGAGLGGAIFIYSGDVNISDVTIGNSVARGGNGASRYGEGGGGMYGSSSFSGTGGGGMFASGEGAQGGYGGWGNYQNGDRFGQGGSTSQPGGFGAGGGGNRSGSINAADGGFGGSGGNCYCYYSYSSAGDGGFGAGGGYPFYDGSYGSDGYGATSSSGAGLGGAIFIRSGSLSLSKVTLSNNTASASSGAKGLGGGVFVLHTLNNNNGNNQGMPDNLAEVSACEVSFINNQATSDPNTTNNNDDIFDLAGIINADTGDPVSVMCSDVIFADGFE